MNTCKDYILLIKRIELGIAFVFISTTLLLILGCPRFRQRHHIFSFNLALADLVGVVIYVIFEVKRIRNQVGSPVITDVLIPAVYSSFLVSNISVLLVAVYRFITIKVDPFGVKNIITTTRCVLCCIGSWIFAGLLALLYKRTIHYHVIPFYTTTISLTTTSICYVFIYRSVAKVSSDGNSQLDERKKENQRVLRTFLMILGTTVFFSLYPMGLWLYLSRNLKSDLSPCYILTEELVITTNWISNCIIYWWRLREFRDMIFVWTRRCNATVRVHAVVS
ncbi:uncharacterized protein LOC121418677 [Lytechinus variegatus]|uniref:uncharacterized protein LOC121418677 n=1 Tax=Lytechinus variegatus TaxID=7654 RepID=UPI001BB1D7DE|nr:uncharacterized protein LOC121418677 [Lytechinus variegatus]